MNVRQRQPSPQPQAPEVFYVVIVTTHKGGDTTCSDRQAFGSFRTAAEECNWLQADFDADCEPKRAYVLDTTGVPIAAGGCPRRPAYNRPTP